MEIWATVIIVAIMSLLNWFTVDRQIKNSNEQFKGLLEAQVESDKRKRRWDVSSERLSKLGAELARMAAKGERVVDLVRLMMREAKMEVDSKYGGWIKKGEEVDELNVALGDWNSYMASRVFQEVLFMQDDLELVDGVDEVRREYDRARYFMNITDISRWFNWLSEEGKEREVEDINRNIDKNIELIIRNRVRVAEVQSEIKRRLEKL